MTDNKAVIYTSAVAASDTNKETKAEILQFGQIVQRECGGLEFSNFEISVNDEFDSTEVCLITVVMRRLQEELVAAEARQRQMLGWYDSKPAPLLAAVTQPEHPLSHPPLFLAIQALDRHADILVAGGVITTPSGLVITKPAQPAPVTQDSVNAAHGITQQGVKA